MHIKQYKILTNTNSLSLSYNSWTSFFVCFVCYKGRYVINSSSRASSPLTKKPTFDRKSKGKWDCMPYTGWWTTKDIKNYTLSLLPSIIK